MKTYIATLLSVLFHTAIAQKQEQKGKSCYSSAQSGDGFEGTLNQGKYWTGELYHYDKEGILFGIYVYLEGKVIKQTPGFDPETHINQKDAQGRKDGYWINYGVDRRDTGYGDSLKVEEGWYVADRKEGLWTKYEPDGKTIKIQGIYTDNRPAGAATHYMPSGKIRETSAGCSGCEKHEKVALNFTDDNGKQGRWIYYGKDRPDSGYGDSIKVEEGNYINGRKDGLWVKYQSDGKAILKYGIYDGSPMHTSSLTIHHEPDTLNNTDEQQRKNGHWIYTGKDRPDSNIAPDGKVEEGDYVNSSKEGVWIKYHNDGKTPKLISEYENNRPKGLYLKFDKKGRIKETGYFLRNALSGDSTIFYDTLGNVVRRESTVQFPTTRNNTWSNSAGIADTVNIPGLGTGHVLAPKVFRPDDYNQVYNQVGELWLDGRFQGGLVWDGKEYVYDKDGILLYVRVFKEGKFHSFGQL